MTFNGTHKQALEERGLYEQAVAAQWEPFEVRGRAGLAYPVYNAKGQPYTARRWKSLDGASPKYLWLWEKPERAKYYFLPDTFSSIQQKNHTAHLAGGEPDVLAYHAAQHNNAFCWLDGEGSPPKTLANDLAAMGVTTLIYAPDRDDAGMKSAAKVQRLLEGTDVMVVLYQLPGEMGSGYDVNNLWVDSGTAEQFASTFYDLPIIDPVDLFLSEHARATMPDTDSLDAGALHSEWIGNVQSAMGTPALIEGTTKRWHCPLPGHADNNPSFTFATKQNAEFPWPMCTCGIQDNKNAWDLVAESVGVSSWAEYKAMKAAERGYKPQPRQQTFATRGTDQLPAPKEQLQWVDMSHEYAELKERLEGGQFMKFPPVAFPLTVLHKFGGIAKFMRRQKLIAVTGVSGGGKTLLLKTMMMVLMRAGYDVIWWGPEWSPEEYAEMDLQRVGGMSMDTLDEWEMWKHFERQGIIKEMSAKYDLHLPSAAQIKRAIKAMDELLAIPGRMYVIPDLSKPIDEICAVAKTITDVKRAEGRDVLVFAFDYIQLATHEGRRDWSKAEIVASKIKALCEGMSLCGFVSTQVRKGDSEAVREGEELTHGSAQGLSDAQFNLFLTLTPIVDESGDFTDNSWLAVGKNSKGRRGRVRVYADYEHLTILDREVQVTHKNIQDELDGAIGYAPEER